MGLEDSSKLSVIADGAPWIWEQAKRRLSPHASWCVDVYHVSEDIHHCGKAMFGEGEPARSWAEKQLGELLKLSGPKFIATLDERIRLCVAQKDRDALDRLRGYLAANRDRMWYSDRLREGKPIGSGAIEGACKKIGSD